MCSLCWKIMDKTPRIIVQSTYLMEDTVKIGWNTTDSVSKLPRKRQRLAAESLSKVNSITKFSSDQFEALVSTLEHRETWDHNDWKLNDQLFKVVDREFGPHTLDMFSSKKNAQLPRFLTAQEDAFTFDLSNGLGNSDGSIKSARCDVRARIPPAYTSRSR